MVGKGGRVGCVKLWLLELLYGGVSLIVIDPLALILSGCIVSEVHSSRNFGLLVVLLPLEFSQAGVSHRASGNF